MGASFAACCSERDKEDDHPQALQRQACQACGGVIAGRYVKSGNSFFHAGCFVCSTCRRPITDGCVQTKEGQHLCAACQPWCYACRQPLAGHMTVSAGGCRFHAECFRCSGCGTKIADGHYPAGPGVYHCEACHASAWQAREDSLDSRVLALERQAKLRNAADFRLQWRPELVPCNRQVLQALGVGQLSMPPGEQMCVCCDPATKQVTVVAAPRSEPRAAVNISYLATALRVLRQTRHEPQFSLDPKNAHDIGGDLQVKMFYPPWLAATVAGEVLFQADYELKQICMGDRQLPCLPSLLDGQGPWSQQEERGGRAARQWFVVRRAGVTVAQDGALVPHCELGVDARQLVPSERGYVDAARTDERDSMVRMAKAISEHFAEVAAALPAVAELVHLARATVLARYLLESGCRCDEATLARYALPRCPEGDRYSMEIPTLRTKQLASSVVKQGRELLMQKRHRSIHGGVDLGVKAEKVPTQVVHQPLLGPDAGPRPPLPLFHCAAAAS